MQEKILDWPRAFKHLIVLTLDVVLCLIATWMAFSLRFDSPNWPSGAQWWAYALTPALAVPVFIRFGLYRAILRYTDQAALLATAKAVAVYGAILLGLLLWLRLP